MYILYHPTPHSVGVLTNPFWNAPLFVVWHCVCSETSVYFLAGKKGGECGSSQFRMGLWDLHPKPSHMD